MTGLMAAGDIALTGLAVATSVLLRKSIRLADEIWARESPVARIPSFRLSIAGSQELVRRRDVAGSPVLFMFVDPHKMVNDDDWRRVFGSVRLLAGRHECRPFLVRTSDRPLLDPSPVDFQDFVVLDDEDGAFAKSMRLTHTPAVYVFDARGKLVKSGTMLGSGAASP